MSTQTQPHPLTLLRVNTELLTNMEANEWEELSFLLDSAGVPADKAMGLGQGKYEGIYYFIF